MSKQTIVIIAVAVLVIGVLGFAVAWYFKPDTVQVREVFTEVPQIKEVVKIKKVMVPGPKEIQVVEKEKIVEKISLPAWVKDAKNQQILTTGEVRPDPERGDIQAVAVMNTDNGKTAMLMMQKDRPFLGLPNQFTASAAYGLSLKHGQIAVGRVTWQPLRIGCFYLGGEIEGNSEPDLRILAMAECRF